MDDRRIGVDLGSNTIKIIEIREVGDLFEPKHLKTYAVKDTKVKKSIFYS